MWGRKRGKRRIALYNNNSKMCLLLLAVSDLLDLPDDGIDLADAPGVDGSALLLAGLSADVGGNVVKDGGEGDVDNVSLAEGGGNGELVLIKFVQGLGVEVADEELGTVIGVSAVLFEEDSVEVSSLSLSSSTAESETVSGGNVAGKSTLGGAVDEALADEDLSADDDGGGGEELGVDNGHGSDEGENNKDSLHFAASGFV